LVIVEKSLVTLAFRPTVEVIDESMLWREEMSMCLVPEDEVIKSSNGNAALL
jgi:hypothetical protein